jgi:peroxiredoxin Q/BCP
MRISALFSKPELWIVGTASILLTMLLAGEARAGTLEAGAAMPEWSLPDQNSVVVRSSDLAGKTYLLWFYPKAQTPGCTVEARGLRDRFAPLEKAGVTVLGVSFDDPASNKAFVEAETLPFRLLSDEDRKLALAVGAADSGSSRFARRISYLVGGDGKVRKAWTAVDPATHAAEVLAETAPNGGAK